MSSVPHRRRPIADILIRESNDAQLSGPGPEQMIADCRAKAAALGADVDRVILESAKRDEWDAPAFNAEIERAKAGAIDYLISWDTARLSGDIGKHLYLRKELAGYPVEIHYATVAFSRDAEGEIQEDFLGLFNRYERVKIRARTQNGIVGKLARQEPVGGGPLAFGVAARRDGRDKLVGYAPNEDTVAILGWIVCGLRTRTARSLADELNAAGVPTASGRGRWRAGTILKMARNPLYGGVYRYGVTKRTPARNAEGKRVYRQAPHPPSHVATIPVDPILPSDVIAAAAAALEARRRGGRRHRGTGADPFTLRGRARCAACGGVLSTANNHGYRRYLCLRRTRPEPGRQRCATREIPAEALERYVWDAVVAQLSDPERRERLLAAAMDGGEAGRAYERQRASLRADLDEQRRRFAAAAATMLDVGPGSELYEVAKAGARVAELATAALESSLERHAEQRPTVWSADEAERARTAWAEVGRKLAAAAADGDRQRAVYAGLGLGLSVGEVAPGAAGGVRLGRSRWYGVGWSGHLALLDSDADRSASASLSRSRTLTLALGDRSAA